MTTDIERELRELFREKAGEAPVSTLGTSGTAPQQVLRRGRRHQVGTVLGSTFVALLLAVGSFAGLRSLLRSDTDPFQTGQDYEVFERTATIEAFTITSPSDWFLVNEWPLSMQMAVGSGSASQACTVDSAGNETCTPIERTEERVESLPHGLPMFQLSNADMGLSTIACGQELAADAAVLYVGLDYERAIFGAQPDGAVGPSDLPPAELFPAADSAVCGPGMYEPFSVGGEPFFAWIGLGERVAEEDRATVLAAYESMVVDDSWEPVPPDQVTPAYVIAGGETDSAGRWGLEVRPGNDVEFTLFVGGASGRTDISVGSQPVSWCCMLKADPDRAADVLFGLVRKDATGVEFRPTGGEAIPGTVLPLPPSLGPTDLDVFFIEGTGELPGGVVALGLEERTPEPPIATDRADEVRLDGALLGQDWSARFTGAFADETACIAVTIEGESHGSLCQEALGDSLAQDRSSMHGWPASDLHLLTGTVPPGIVEIRYVGDDDAIVPTQLRCAMGPLGWTNPDRKVCAIALPTHGSGTLRYLDASGDVVFEEGIGWGQAEPELCCPVNPELGGTYWAVYAWVGSGADEAEIEATQRYLADRGVQGLRGSLACDEGAAEALGTSADHKVAVYFETEDEANTFALDAGLLGHEADPVVAGVTIACLE
jgi:hypothetical protein